MTEARKETYEQLVALGKTPWEAWELIEQMDFAEDYDEPETYHYEEDYDEPETYYDEEDRDEPETYYDEEDRDDE